MKNLEKLIQALEATKAIRRRHYLIAEYLANRLQIAQGSHLVLVFGVGGERSNIEAIAHWVSKQNDEKSSHSKGIERMLAVFEGDLDKILRDKFPSS